MYIPFDSDSAMKLSALKKSEYKKTKNSFLKLISLNKLVDVKSLLMKLGVCNSNIEKTAEKIFAQCQKNEVSDHPQFVALSCFLACKFHKEKVPKKNFIAASNLRPLQWTQLEKTFGGLAPQPSKQPSDSKGVLEERDETQYSSNRQREKRKLNTEGTHELEDYDVWKARTLKQAYAEINAKKLAKS